MRPRVRRGAGQVFQLRVELQRVVPTRWRRLEIAGRASLRELDEVIEAAFLPGTGGYRFVVDGVVYDDEGNDPPPGRGADDVSVDTLALHVGARFMLSLDGLTEPWEYILTVEGVTPRLVGQRVPLCTDGAGALPDWADGPSDIARLLHLSHDGTSPAGDVPSCDK